MKTLIKKRFKALLMDIVIIGALGVIILIIIMANTDMDFLCILGLVTFIIYSLFFSKDIVNGQSIGKKNYKLQIVTEKGKTVSLRNILIRNIIAILQPVDALYMINNNGKRLGDIICKTKVINVV